MAQNIMYTIHSVTQSDKQKGKTFINYEKKQKLFRHNIN